MIAIDIIKISIHALREEGDVPLFQRREDLLIISIHALREEGDPLSAPAWIAYTNFYPRPPRGGRRGKAGDIVQDEGFLSTPSARRATTSAA